MEVMFVRFFNNIKIVQKLLISFLIALILMGVIGFIGISNMKEISDNAISMHDDNLKPSNHINALKSNLLQTSTYMIMLLDENHTENLQNTDNDIKMLQSEIKEHIKQLDGISLTTEEQKLYEELRKGIDGYSNANLNIIEFINKNNFKEAKKLYENTLDARDTMFINIDKLIELKMMTAMDTNAKNITIYKKSSTIMIAIIIFSILITIIIGFLISNNISKQVKQILKACEALGNGNLNQIININSKDEFGNIAKALNLSTQNMKDLITEVIENSKIESEVSKNLSDSTDKVNLQMKAIEKTARQISIGAQDLSASTQEVNASTQEIGEIIAQLEDKANDANTSSDHIMERALNIKEVGSKAIADGDIIYKEKKANILSAIEEGKVVEQVKTMAVSIGNIATQTNLLALNAAIEAARAGEQGKGFAVVAEEIRNLAEQSANTVSNIQEVVNEVQAAFYRLSQSGEDILKFMQDSVTPNYNMLISTGLQYEKDSEFFKNMSGEIFNITKIITRTIEQLSNSSQNVTETAGESSEGSEVIVNRINEISMALKDVSKSAQSQAELSNRLNSLIQNFNVA